LKYQPVPGKPQAASSPESAACFSFAWMRFLVAAGGLSYLIFQLGAVMLRPPENAISG